VSKPFIAVKVDVVMAVGLAWKATAEAQESREDRRGREMKKVSWLGGSFAGGG